MNTAEKLNSNGVLLDLINGLVSLPDPAPESVNIVATGIQMDSRRYKKVIFSLPVLVTITMRGSISMRQLRWGLLPY